MPHFKRAAVYEEQKRTGKWGQLVEETKDRIPEYSNKTIAKISHLDNGCLWPEIKVSFSHHLSILQSMCLHFIISILFSKYIFFLLLFRLVRYINMCAISQTKQRDNHWLGVGSQRPRNIFPRRFLSFDIIALCLVGNAS